MKLVQVNYECARSFDDPELAQQFATAAEAISSIPGLLWKLWGYDEGTRTAAGVYLFDTEVNARAWADGPMTTSLGAAPGVGRIEARMFDIDEALSGRTGAGGLLARTTS